MSDGSALTNIAMIDAWRHILAQTDWTPAERVAVALMLDAFVNDDSQSVSCVMAYDRALGPEHDDDVDAVVGRVMAGVGATVLYSDDGHVMATSHAHVADDGGITPTDGIVERYTCGAPDCGNHLGEMIFRVDASPPPPVAGGSDAPPQPAPAARPARTSRATSARRTARKRQRQDRKHGRRS